MAKVTCNLSISADGYSAWLNPSEERPFGDDGGDGWGSKLHAWFVETPEESRAEVDQMTAAKAFVMGRNMCGPVRGEWDRQWNGWWGPTDAYGDPRLAGRNRPRPVRVASARCARPRARLVLRDLVNWAARWAVGARSIGRWR